MGCFHISSAPLHGHLDMLHTSWLVPLLPAHTGISQLKPRTLSLSTSHCHRTSLSKGKGGSFPWGAESSLFQTSSPPSCAMQELLDTLQQEKLALEQSILELQANTSRLEEQTQELRKRERLLVFFPELHLPTEMQFESKGADGSTVGLCLGVPRAPRGSCWPQTLCLSH